MKRRHWRYLAIGAATYLLILISTFPAERARPWLEAQVADLSLQAVTGSVFSGRAGQLIYQGLDIGEVHWQFRPLALLLGRAEYHVELAHPENPGTANVGITLGGRVYGHDLSFMLLPDRVINHYSPVAVQTSGKLHLLVGRLEQGDTLPELAAGRLAWQDAAVLAPLELVLGQLQLDLQSEADAMVATVTGGGELGASGDIKFFAGGQYRVNLVLRPGYEVSTETLGMLETVAQVQANGDYLINTSGSL